MAIQFRRGTSTKIKSSTEVLAAGQPLVDIAGKKLYIGDGSTQIKDLTAINATPAELSAKQDTLVSGTTLKTINGVSLLDAGDIEIDGTKVLDGTGNSTTQAMSQKAVTDSLNDLEAKLNENMIKDPSKTYIIAQGSFFPQGDEDTKFKAPAGCTIDWGDGVVETFTTAATEKTTHTYTDGINAHLIAIAGLKSIPHAAFAYSEAIRAVTLGSTVKRIEARAFVGCSIDSFTIPNSVTYIGDYALAGGFTKVIVGNRVEQIGDGAFSRYGDIVITSLYKPPEVVNGDAFDSGMFYGKVIVPKSAINKYKTATGWSTHADKIVYEVDSGDLTDYVTEQKLNTTLQDKYPDEVAEAEKSEWMSDGYMYVPHLTIRDSSAGTAYAAVIRSSIKFPTDEMEAIKTGTMALQEDTPTFSVEVW